MLLAQATFLNRNGVGIDEAEERIFRYCSALIHNGQICDADYSYCWRNHQFVVICYIARADATRMRFHSEIGRTTLRMIKQSLGSTPEWTLLEEPETKRFRPWKSSPFFFVATDARKSRHFGEATTASRFPHICSP